MEASSTPNVDNVSLDMACQCGMLNQQDDVVLSSALGPLVVISMFDRSDGWTNISINDLDLCGFLTCTFFNQPLGSIYQMVWI
jgi:hypothetical protein